MMAKWDTVSLIHILLKLLHCFALWCSILVAGNIWGFSVSSP
jgi:hypothetical protein